MVGDWRACNLAAWVKPYPRNVILPIDYKIGKIDNNVCSVYTGRTGIMYELNISFLQQPKHYEIKNPLHCG